MQNTYVRTATRRRESATASLFELLSSIAVICCVGLIDFRQPFNNKNHVEWEPRSLIYENEEFSGIPPDDNT